MNNKRVVELYRDILKLHRKKLNIEMRMLGDQYVKQEFKRHKNAKPEFIHSFIAEWDRYKHFMETKKERFGEVLSKDTERLLSSEQKEKLLELKEAAYKVGHEIRTK